MISHRTTGIAAHNYSLSIEDELKDERDRKTFMRFIALVKKYSHVMVVSLVHVQSFQTCLVREGLRKLDSDMLVGKVSVLLKAVDLCDTTQDCNSESSALEMLAKLRPFLSGQVGLIFTSQDNLIDVIHMIVSVKTFKYAQVGDVLTQDVIIEDMTPFLNFQKLWTCTLLNIPTKIVRGIPHTLRRRVIAKGTVVTQLEKTFFDSLSIQAMCYEMECKEIIDIEGNIYQATRLKVLYDELNQSVTNGLLHLLVLHSIIF